MSGAEEKESELRDRLSDYAAYISIDEDTVCLDGHFTAEELRCVIQIMEERAAEHYGAKRAHRPTAPSREVNNADNGTAA